MNRLFLYLLCFIIISASIYSVSSEVQTLPDGVKTSQCVMLPQIYANSSWQNITTIQLPDKSLININARMTLLSPGFFNYSFCNTSTNGNYIVNGIGDVDGVPTTWNYMFVVNPLGKVLTNSQAILYFLIFIIAFILFIGSVVLAVYLPSDNKRNEMTGYVIAVSNIKYVKIFMYATSYLLLMLMMYFGWTISYGYLDLEFLGGLFNFIFYAMVIALLPLFIVGMYVVIANKVKDSQVADYLLRGLHVK